MFGLKVRDLAQDEKGHYRATVVNGDAEIRVNRQYGSWQTDDRREVLPQFAAWLQEHVRKLERKRP